MHANMLKCCITSSSTVEEAEMPCAAECFPGVFWIILNCDMHKKEAKEATEEFEFAFKNYPRILFKYMKLPYLVSGDRRGVK